MSSGLNLKDCFVKLIKLDDIYIKDPPLGCQNEVKDEYYIWKFFKANKNNLKKINFQQRKPGRPKKSYICHLCFKAFLLNCDLRDHIFFAHTSHPTREETSKVNLVADEDPSQSQISLIENYQSFIKERDEQLYKELVETHNKNGITLILPKEIVKDDDGTPNICNICGKTFNKKLLLRRHFESVHLRLRPHLCYDCGEKFASKDTLAQHIRTIHEKSRPFLCTLCPGKGKAFTRKQCLTTHIRVAHRDLIINQNNPDIEITIVDKSQNNEADSSNLANVNTPTTNNLSFDSHSKIKLKYYKCHFCGKIFNQEAHLNRHIKSVHERVKPFKCCLCPKLPPNHFITDDPTESYLDAKGLHGPVRDHYERDPTTGFWVKSFSRKEFLIKHIRSVHQKYRAYGCELCGMKYCDKRDMENHRKKAHSINEHNSSRIQRCPYKDCAHIVFTSKIHLTKHIKNFHKPSQPDYSTPQNFQNTELNFLMDKDGNQNISTTFVDENGNHYIVDTINFIDDKQNTVETSNSTLIAQLTSNTNVENAADISYLTPNNANAENCQILTLQSTSEGLPSSQIMIDSSNFVLQSYESSHNTYQQQSPLMMQQHKQAQSDVLNQYHSSRLTAASFTCDSCDKAFSSRPALIRHLKTVHENHKAFACRICGRSFNQRPHLERHLASLIHADVLKYVCDYCGRRFALKSRLEKHLFDLNYHRDPNFVRVPKYVCYICTPPEALAIGDELDFIPDDSPFSAILSDIKNRNMISGQKCSYDNNESGVNINSNNEMSLQDQLNANSTLITSSHIDSTLLNNSSDNNLPTMDNQYLNDPYYDDDGDSYANTINKEDKLLATITSNLIENLSAEMLETAKYPTNAFLSDTVTSKLLSGSMNRVSLRKNRDDSIIKSRIKSDNFEDSMPPTLTVKPCLESSDDPTNSSFIKDPDLRERLLRIRQTSIVRFGRKKDLIKHLKEVHYGHVAFGQTLILNTVDAPSSSTELLNAEQAGVPLLQKNELLSPSSSFNTTPLSRSEETTKTHQFLQQGNMSNFSVNTALLDSVTAATETNQSINYLTNNECCDVLPTNSNTNNTNTTINHNNNNNNVNDEESMQKIMLTSDGEIQFINESSIDPQTIINLPHEIHNNLIIDQGTLETEMLADLVQNQTNQDGSVQYTTIPIEQLLNERGNTSNIIISNLAALNNTLGAATHKAHLDSLQQHHLRQMGKNFSITDHNFLAPTTSTSVESHYDITNNDQSSLLSYTESFVDSLGNSKILPVTSSNIFNKTGDSVENMLAQSGILETNASNTLNGDVNKSHLCEFCGKVFNANQTLHEHIAYFHQNETQNAMEPILDTTSEANVNAIDQMNY